MHISSITLSGFQCFGLDPVKVDLENEITALIGSNSSGKTALLQALLRLFGTVQSEREIRRRDFYMLPDKSLDDPDITESQLWIEVRIEVPELQDGEESAIAPIFQKLQIPEENSPYLRARLEATWRQDITAEGTIEQSLFWILEEGEAEDGYSDESAERIDAYDRSRISVEYIPAQRDAAKEVRRQTAGSVVNKLLRAVNWSDDVKTDVERAAKAIRDAADEEKAFQIINEALAKQWQSLYQGTYNTNPTLHIVQQQFRELIRSVDVSFKPTEIGDQRTVDDLSDGTQSLFHLSLLLAYYRIVIDLEGGRQLLVAPGVTAVDDDDTGNESDETTRQDNDGDDAAGDLESAGTGIVNRDQSPFVDNKIDPPSLVILALEEPENHLTPYYLARIIRQVRDLATSNRVQGLLTTHSASTLSRIEPEQIRHLRLTGDERTSQVSRIRLPDEEEEARKYVRQAVQSYPEIYFAKFVVFGEGDSEKIVLPHLSRLLGFEFDPSFVAMVPLGGRHVNHFWRLVSDLGMPHATLLDLDIGRSDAGWGRIKYVLKELLEIGEDPDQVLQVDGGPSFSADQLEQLEDIRDLSDRDELRKWVTHIQKFGVFFSEPLDLDWSMLESFPDAYKGSAPNEPTGGLETAIKNVLKKNHVYEEAKEAGFYDEDDNDRFKWYRYLFDSRSKPSSHFGGLGSISSDDPDIEDQIPESLRALLEYADDKVKELG